MKQSHKNAFFSVAEEHMCWIGLREPNSHADKWIGKPGFVPKPMSCKGKTSDNPAFEFAGLVVHPGMRPEAFLRSNLTQAKASWNKFSIQGKLPAGYKVVQNGSERGLVKLNNRRIHADFDLMTIVVSNDSAGFVDTPKGELRQRFEKVKADINRSLHSPMIQHGPEFMFTEGVGARESENVYWFGPNRQFQVGRSSMPRAAH